MAEAVVSAAVSAPSVAVPAPLPVRAVLPWALFVGLLALIALYFVGAEQGATSLFAGSDVHEWVHDGRHLLGFPCH
ncbi:CbtB domain-containing protein [Streptomyces sp. LMG1-1-1.1]|uniref:CbtB domain-containing protein n=1 Tax=Streptomyces sp. LMG1-1-1.1 TaxID=3135245 RepID=UPI0034660CEB